MDGKFLKPYDPANTEGRIYEKWEKSGYFNPDNLPERNKKGESFSVVLPPPNVTGTLHAGHALTITIEDIMVRYARMNGKRTVWIPGTDHAAIATQSKVEKEIEKKEGKRRKDFSREEFLERVNRFAAESHDTIVNQVRRMGASVDWSREAFTLDEKRNKAVRTAFKRMYDDGIIYRGHRIVNWDPKGQTTISDDEVIYKEEKTKFYYLKYGPFTIGTARPETKFGDKYVVMHPDDARYADYKQGQKINLEWINGPVEATVIKDTAIDPAFGTGVMTITPWHSNVDFEIAERHNLDKEQIIDNYGRLLPVAGEFAGVKITEARTKIIDKLKAKGLLVKEEDYVHQIATAERSGGTIEPQIMNQWFVGVNKKFKLAHSSLKSFKKGDEVTLKELMLEVVRNGEIKFIPDRFEKVYFHWIENLHDWCISRQIWYGHRIPVSYKGNEVYCGEESKRDLGWKEDEDTLDTWFSSGLWTFSTLGWPEINDKKNIGKDGTENDLANFHPISIMETGRDIIFFWVARMILMSTYLMGEVPFKTVYLHGLVLDGQGRKMSKSLGNYVDPLEVIAKYGADAYRMSLVVGVGPGSDSKVGEDKVKAYKNFANKIWNIARFIFTSVEDEKTIPKTEYTEADVELIKERDSMFTEITGDMDNYKYYLAAEKLYHYIWHRFADVIIEDSKKVLKEGNDKEKISRKVFLMDSLEKMIKALHPFMPFVTEEIWSYISWKKEDSLMIAEWPAK